MSTINIIGFPQAGLVNDLLNFILQDGVEISVLSPDNFIEGHFKAGSRFINAVTKDLNLRLQINNKLDQDNLQRFTFIHSTCVIDPSAKIGAGSFLGPFVGVYHEVVVGKDCVIAPYSMLSHRAQLGNNCMLNPGVLITGTTRVGNNCQFGVRSTVLDQLTICDNVFVGAASTVNKDIATPGRWVGSPARQVL